MSEAMTVYEPHNINDAMRLAEVLVQSHLLPRAITTPQQAFTIMAAGKELGLTAMQSLRSIHVIDGKPSCSADLILALCKRAPAICRYFRLVKSDAQVATYETLREGDTEPTQLSFTIEEAKAAGLVNKDNWKKYPAAMLRARCVAALARAVYPDLVLGVYETDEIQQMARVERDVTPAAEAPTEPVAAAPAVAVVPEPKADTPSAADALRVQIEAAATLTALEAMAPTVGAAHKAGHITTDERKSLVEVYLAREAALRQVAA